MENQFETWRRLGISQLRGDDLVQAAMPIDMEIVGSSQQVHRKDQAHESEVMIAVKMADKNMVDAVEICLKAHELHLGTLAAVNEEMPVLNLYEL
jgi:hypothetical protein